MNDLHQLGPQVMNGFTDCPRNGRLPRNRGRSKYEKLGLPRGSGLMEGACKFVVAKRFKGSGMRWKKRDNGSVLRARLAVINETLASFFEPQPAPFTIPVQKAAA